MAFYVFVRQGVMGENDEFHKEHQQATQLPQSTAATAWYLWAEICSGFEDDSEWERNKRWMHENGVRRYWNRDLPSISVEISVKEIA